jgi:glycosyltransferase involved in cell wall biosynthesis
MRVVWITKSEWRKPGPIVYMGLLNAASFARSGYATEFYVGAGEASDTAADLTEFYGVDATDNLVVRRVPADSSTRTRAVYRAACADVAAMASAGTHVLVLTREIGVLPALLRIRRRHRDRVAVVHETHDFYVTVHHLPSRSLSAYRRMWAERSLLPRTDGLLCITEFQRALYQEHFPDLPIVAWPLGCTTQRESTPPEERRGQRRAVYLGHTHRRKGLDLILGMASRLREAGVQFEILGGYREKAVRLDAAVRAAGVDANVQATPFLEPAAMHERLSREFSVGLVPLEDTFYNRYLTCPVKALDCLAHGIPIVGSDLPSIRAVAGSAAVFCPPGDAGAFARGILELLEDARTYEAACRASRERAAELSWDARAEAIATFGESLFQRRSRTGDRG